MSFYSQFAPYYSSIFPLEERAYEFLRSFVRRAGAGAQVGAADRGAARVLDLGCGTGDYCGRFASEGLEATGIDLDPEMVAAAERRYPGATFRVADLRDVGTLARPREPGAAKVLVAPFDLVFSIGNVVSHVGKDELPSVLDGVRAALGPSGVWVLQVVNWDHILTLKRHRFPDIAIEGGRVVFTREYPLVSEERVRFVTRLLEAGETVFEGEAELHPARSAEYIRRASDLGLELAGHYADFARTPYDPGRESSNVMVFVKREGEPDWAAPPHEARRVRAEPLPPDARAGLEYPCRWGYKVIGGAEDELRRAVSEVAQDRSCTVELSRTSRTEKYTCLNVTMTVYDEDDRTRVYDALKSHPAIRLVL
jgi:SAM-dependent methyltransferase